MRRALSCGLVAALASAGGCGSDPPAGAAHDAGTDAAVEAVAAQTLYPTLAEVYAGPQGVYRGCSPNGGVCHNSREYPNLGTMGSIVESIGARCNERREDPRTIHDLCERRGDLLVLGGASAEIGYLESSDPERLTWGVRLATDMPVPPRGAAVRVQRPYDGAAVDLYDLTQSVGAVRDPSDARLVWLTLETPDRNEIAFLERWFAEAGVPGNPGSLQVGDPNRNGTFGRTLGGGLITPGDPAKSYLITRLLDPEAGPLMPRANCCHWTKTSLRALWCWVAGLAKDGGNAMAPIDYAACPPLPASADGVLYPEPGPACETSGMCPVRPVGEWPDDAPPTFTNLYKYVFQPSCGGSGSCHDAAQPGAALSMKSEDDAYRDLVTGARARVKPGDAAGSLLIQRLSPDLCVEPKCTTMPLGRAPLSAELRDRISMWIQTGAAR